MPEKTPDEQELTMELNQLIRTMLIKGKNQAEIVKELKRKGVNEEDAIRMVSWYALSHRNNKRPVIENQPADSMIGPIITGAMTILIGMALLIFIPKSSGEWSTALAFGAFITGAVMIYRGTRKGTK